MDINEKDVNEEHVARQLGRKLGESPEVSQRRTPEFDRVVSADRELVRAIADNDRRRVVKGLSRDQAKMWCAAHDRHLDIEPER